MPATGLDKERCTCKDSVEGTTSWDMYVCVHAEDAWDRTTCSSS